MGLILIVLGLIGAGVSVVSSTLMRRRRRTNGDRSSDYRPEEIDVQSRPPFFWCRHLEACAFRQRSGTPSEIRV